jgi:hypothetical protein
MLGLINTN